MTRAMPVVVACTLVAPLANTFAQTLQEAVEGLLPGGDRLRFEHIHYRPARYEMKNVTEPENERPNEGGLLFAYYTNTSDKPIRLAFWRANGKDESHWRLGGFIAWDRHHDATLAPGRTSVLEIDAVAPDFAPGRRCRLSWVDRDTWRPVGSTTVELREDPVRIALIRLLPGAREVEVHVQWSGTHAVEPDSLEIVGVASAGPADWVGRQPAAAGHAIARLRLEQPLPPSQLILVRLGVRSRGRVRFLYAHRRAFVDTFPIGTWGAEPDRYDAVRRHHIDTCVRGGRPDDAFFGRDAARVGLRALVPSGLESLDEVRALRGHPAVAALMLYDEPDWHHPPAVVAHTDRLVRHINGTHPTFVTLCRNVKFFEYAPIPDIACMDHYCVAAPSSSRWPMPYGTRLEEAAWYTEDLKRAAEPRPIWVWSQGLHIWEGRPQRPTPTPDELAAQLWLHIGRGAKGILWFTFDEEAGRRYPDTRDAVRRCGRVLRIARDGLLGSEPVPLSPRAPDGVDVATLVSWDRLYIILTNLRYEMHPTGYRWRPVSDVKVSCELPSWIRPEAALELSPDGAGELPMRQTEGRVELTAGELRTVRIVALPNRRADRSAFDDALKAAIRDEGGNR